jgi:two-component system response regulator PilR (NtrC family)
VVEKKKATGFVLVVDDEQSMRDFLAIALKRAGHEVTTTGSGADAVRLLADGRPFEVVITDLTMPGVDGMEVLRQGMSVPNPPAMIMITAYATTDTAVQAMKLGAYDYLLKPFKVDEIELVVSRAIERRSLTRENIRLRDQLRGVSRLDNMVGRSALMQKVFELVRKVAATRTNVLIRGESGTGKELVARALHNFSDRESGPFVAVNCGAIPESLMESELFGHTKGAFTGATQDRIGVFETAQEGTLFLDEIGELDPNMQVKLLRVLQERRIRPVGQSEENEVNCRVVAATNRDLEAAVESGEFRNDLYFRLNVVQVVLPPLRHRPDDVPLLVDKFFERYNAQVGGQLEGITPEAYDWFQRYDYPGNVRELENLVERAVTLETSTRLSAEHLPSLERRRAITPTGEDALPSQGIDLDSAIADLERRLIEAALKRTGGVRKRAASILGISFRSLRYRLEKLGIEVTRGESGGDTEGADTG